MRFCLLPHLEEYASFVRIKRILSFLRSFSFLMQHFLEFHSTCLFFSGSHFRLSLSWTTVLKTDILISLMENIQEMQSQWESCLPMDISFSRHLKKIFFCLNSLIPPVFYKNILKGLVSMEECFCGSILLLYYIL